MLYYYMINIKNISKNADLLYGFSFVEDFGT